MKKLVKFVRIVLSVLIVFGWYKGMQALIDFHYSCCPELYGTPINRLLMYLPILMAVLLMPCATAGAAMLSGYRLHKLHLLFLEITQPDKLRVRLTRKLGGRIIYLPPRTDGTSPYVLTCCSAYLSLAVLAVPLAVLAVIFWRMPASRYLNNYLLSVLLWIFLWPMLPTKNSFVDRILSFRKSRDLRRAWECNLHMYAAVEQKVKLVDMPEEWFQPYPAEIADHPIVRINNFNRASRLINQEREKEGYEVLRCFFDLEPKPDTHGLIAGAILNGAACEALADLPPMCLSQLDHPSLKLPWPGWDTQRLMAEYARALFLHRDEAEAAAILPKLEAALEKEERPRDGLEKLQRKAGILAETKAK